MFRKAKIMKNRLSTLILSAVGVLALSACGKETKENVQVQDFNFPGAGYVENDYFALKSLSYNLAVGETKEMSIETFPQAYKNSSLVFTSTNPEVVTVSDAGVLTGVKKGHAEIKISSSDESVSSKVKVVVSEASTKEGVKNAIDSISASYESYTAPTKFTRYEYSEEFYYREGVQEYGSKSSEALAYDSVQGYFYVEGPYMTYRVPNGSPEVSNGKWLFYSINDGLFVRMIHITPTSKNYFDLNTSSYPTYDAAIRGILNCFFVSGEKIINDPIEDAGGKNDFEDFIGFSSTKFYSVDSSSLYISYDESNSNQTVEADDEINYFNIPTGTKYSYTYNQQNYFVDGGCSILSTNMTMSYKVGNENWQRRFLRSQIFDKEVKIEKVKNPKDNGYTLVDTMYDL